MKIIIMGLFALIGSLLLWGQGFLLNPPKDIDLSYPIADVLINAPASIIAGIGLIKLKKIGFYMSWLVAGIYSYASVEIFVDVFQANEIQYEILVPQIFAIIIAFTIIITTTRNSDRFS